MIDWRWKRFPELTGEEVYRLLTLRSDVFVVEQRSIYLDPDGLDRAAFHLLGTDGNGALVAYLRILPPGTQYAEASFGRVVLGGTVRGQGLGRELVRRALAFLKAEYPEAEVVIGAQQYLRGFYEGFGFAVEGEPYDDGGVPHLHMRRPAAS